jgi:hypothetical protein
MLVSHAYHIVLALLYWYPTPDILLTCDMRPKLGNKIKCKIQQVFPVSMRYGGRQVNTVIVRIQLKLACLIENTATISLVS